METLSDEWIEQLVTSRLATGGQPGRPGPATFELRSGKKTRKFQVVDGVLSALDNTVPDSEDEIEAEVVIPLSQPQLDALLTKEFSLAVAYMQGDIKPVGNTRALLAAVAALD